MFRPQSPKPGAHMEHGRLELSRISYTEFRKDAMAAAAAARGKSSARTQAEGTAMGRATLKRSQCAAHTQKSNRG